MKDELLRQGHVILSKCGKPQNPQGVAIVPLYFGLLVQGSVANNATNVITKEVPGDMPFLIRAIQASAQVSVYINIQLPNGRYLIQTEQLEVEFNGIGSYRYLLTEELECPPGSKIEVTLDSSQIHPGTTSNVSFLFEGCYKALVGGKGASPSYASSLPRYQNGSNILAPCWRQGFYPVTECPEENFTYGDNLTNVATIPVSTGPYSTSVTIQTDLGYDFACKRILFDVVRDAAAVGTVLARLRAGSGYALCDDLFDVAQYIGSTPFAHDWNIRRGDRVTVDLQLVDFSGAGNIKVEVFLEGARSLAQQ